METPKTGLYFVSVDNTNGRDKTVITIERMLGNRDVRHILCSFELVAVPSHGRLIDVDAFIEKCEGMADKEDGNQLDALVFLRWFLEQNAPIILASEEG